MKKLAIVGLLLLMAVVIPATVILVQKRQELRSSAAPATVLSLEPATANKNIDESFNVNVYVNTGSNQIVSVDLVLTFNPQILEAQSVTAGSFLPSPSEIQKDINNTTGKIIYSFYTGNTNAKTGEGVLAVISFKGKAAGTSSVAFDPQSAVGSPEAVEQANVLNNTIPGAYTIGGGEATPTPSTSPSPSPSASPSTSPSPSPSTSPSPSPSASPSPSPSASPSPSPSTSPSPSPSASPSPTPSIFSSTSITAPLAGATVTDTTPTIAGKTIPGATVTITINSPVVTVTVTADANGNWSYTPTTTLADGSHSVSITAQDPSSGQTATKSSSFLIASAGTQTPVATTPAQPVTGSPLPTIILLGAGLLLLILSFIPRIL